MNPAPVGQIPPHLQQQMVQQQPRIPPNMNAQQHLLYQQQQHQQQQQQQQQMLEDQKKLSDMIDGLNLLLSIRDDMNAILDNVAKANPANTSLASKANEMVTNSEQLNKSTSYVANTPHANQAMSTNVTTPASINNTLSQQPPNQNETETNQENTDELINLDSDLIHFLQTSETKQLQAKTEEISKNLNELEKIVKDIQPIVVKDAQEFVPILIDQNETSISGIKFVNNFRWISKVQDAINCTALPNYKRYSQTYMDKKIPKYKNYAIKPIKLEELDKYVSSHLHNDIKVKTSPKSENEFVLDIIMPQNFKFVVLLFDCNVEKIQVKPIDTRSMRMYSLNKTDEVNFDFEHKNTSYVFQKLEESCLFACAYFRAEYGLQHLKYILQWLKHYTNLFNAKCVRCEKHLNSSCLPPTMRDFKTYEPLHFECLQF